MKKDMRDGWTYKKLGEVCEVINGRAYKKEELLDSGKYRVLRVGNFFSNDSWYYSDLELDQKNYCDNGDLLYAWSASFGPRIWKGEKVIYHYHIWKLEHDASLDRRYFFYWLQSPYMTEQVSNEKHGATMSHLTKVIMENLILSIPPLTTQQQIVSELDLLTHILDQKRQQLKEYDALAESIFYDMFGDPNNSSFELTTISELSEEKLAYGSTASAIPFDGKIRYLRITDILPDGSLSPEIMSPSVFDEKYILEEGDILFARSGATVGKTYCYKETDGKGIYAGYLIRMKPNKDKVLPLYIYYFTRTAYYKAFIEANSNAVAQPNVNAKQYGGLKLPLPPLPLQQTFAAKIQSIEHQKQLLKESIKETEMLFQSRMDYWFNG